MRGRCGQMNKQIGSSDAFYKKSCLTYLYLYFRSKMVKTRSHSKKEKEGVEDQLDLSLPNKKVESKSKMLPLTKKCLRNNIISKLRNQYKDKNASKRGRIDFSDEKYLTVVSIEKFNCPICLDPMILPVITPCGHAFCLPCIEESLEHKQSCSLCRENLTNQNIKECSLIKSIIEGAISRSPQQEKMQYQQRIGAFEEKDKERRVAEDLTDKDMVDFFMAGSWHEGQVVDIKEERGEVVVVVRNTDDEDMVQELKLSSRLLAKHRYFTKDPVSYQRFVGGFRVEISGFGHIPIFDHLFRLELSPTIFTEAINQDEEAFRLTFSVRGRE